MEDVLVWYKNNLDYINLIKDIISAIGTIGIFLSIYKFIQFLTNRKILDKRQEVDNDARSYREIHPQLSNYINTRYQGKPKDFKIQLLYIRNYPYNIENDGYNYYLFYYLPTSNHKPCGYISGKGIYILYPIGFSNSIYKHNRNNTWFIDKKGLLFKNYEELNYTCLRLRIPFAHIFGSDFNSDISEGEPVFYTKYKYGDWKLFADDIEALTLDSNCTYSYCPTPTSLRKSKKKRHIGRSLIIPW